MKRILALIFALLMLCACAKTEAPNQTEQKEAVQEEVVTEKEEVKSENILTLTQSSFVNDGVKVVYPQVSEENKNVPFEEINKTLKEGALTILDNYDKTVDGVVIEANYEVTCLGDSSISVAFNGYGNAPGAAHPNNHFYTVNVDITNGKKLGLGSFVTDVDRLVEYMKDKDIQIVIEGDDTKFPLNDIFDYDRIVECDNGESGIHSYITETALGISFEVPHALGDFMKFELPIDELKAEGLVA